MSSANKDVAVETDLAVRRLIARYAQLVDDRDLTAAMDLFSEDGKMLMGGRTYAGRDGLASFFADNPLPDVHLVTNVVVSYGSHPDTLHAVSDLACLSAHNRSSISVIAIGRYHDTMIGSDRVWRFSQRIVKLRQLTAG